MPRTIRNYQKPQRYTGVTFYFIKTGFNEPELDDIFHESLPSSIIDTYEEKEKSIGFLLDYIQKRPDVDDPSGLTDKLNDESWVNSLSSVKVHICDLDGPIDQSIKNNLIEDIKQLQYEELDGLLDSFFRDHGMDELNSTEKVKYLQTYLNARV